MARPNADHVRLLTADIQTQLHHQPERIAVVDEGPGLSPEQLAQPVVAFRSTKAGGTGLGLVIAQAGVHACRGTLSFSVATPRGTRACIALPGDTLDQEA